MFLQAFWKFYGNKKNGAMKGSGKLLPCLLKIYLLFLLLTRQEPSERSISPDLILPRPLTLPEKIAELRKYKD